MSEEFSGWVPVPSIHQITCQCNGKQQARNPSPRGWVTKALCFVLTADSQTVQRRNLGKWPLRSL